MPQRNYVVSLIMLHHPPRCHEGSVDRPAAIGWMLNSVKLLPSLFRSEQRKQQFRVSSVQRPLFAGAAAVPPCEEGVGLWAPFLRNMKKSKEIQRNSNLVAVPPGCEARPLGIVVFSAFPCREQSHALYFRVSCDT